MKPEIQRTIEFRINQSREKLKLSLLMQEKEYYNDSIIFSYLAMFYCIRLLLIQRDEDSDDFERILELYRKYYEPLALNDLKVLDMLTESKEFKDKVENTPGVLASREEAVKYYEYAHTLFDEVLKKLPPLSS